MVIRRLREPPPEHDKPSGIRSPTWFVIGILLVPISLLCLGKSLTAEGAMKLVGLSLTALGMVSVVALGRRKGWGSFLFGVSLGLVIPILFFIFFSWAFHLP